MRNAVLGLVAALALALVISGASIFGIDAWKIVLAIVGFLLFAMGRMSGNTPRE